MLRRWKRSIWALMRLGKPLLDSKIQRVRLPPMKSLKLATKSSPQFAALQRRSKVSNPSPNVTQLVFIGYPKSLKQSPCCIQYVPKQYQWRLTLRCNGLLHSIIKVDGHTLATQNTNKINHINDSLGLSKPQMSSSQNSHMLMHPRARPPCRGASCVTPLRDETRFTFQTLNASAGTLVTARSRSWGPA